MAQNFKSLDSLEPLIKVINETSEALGDKSRTIVDSPISDVLAAALGAGTGGGMSFAALYTLGMTGLSAAGLTSALATAGSIVGGGMAAGVAVLAAPAVILAVSGYGVASYLRNKKLMQKKQELYAIALEKQNAIIRELKDKHNLSEKRVEYLESLNVLLTQALKDLREDIAQVA